MRALVCKRYGSTDELVIEEYPDPVPAGDQVVVDVAAAGLNFPDLLIVAGKYQDKTPPPFVPGNEAAGIVSAVGATVSRFKPGDRVIVLPRGGALAEKCIADESKIAPLPGSMTFAQGAGFGVVYGTSYHALKQRAQLESAETLLVLGAAGGVGIAAVELGKVLGAKLIAAASSDEKLRFATEAGADETINYSKESLRDAVKTLTGNRGVDVVYDPVGGELSLQAYRSLAWHGRHLVVGFAGGDIPAFPANIALLKEASVVGVWWGTWLAKHPDEHRQNMLELGAWAADGSLQPRASEIFAFEDFAAAFRRIKERKALGKVVLRISNQNLSH
ncbi:MAG TPA: NADPH:quinone oxidoreductase family protein [Woeseiaceae bacterium]|nr:NADPH:quinone oxidoreductase family protein [Woeseiaceae bacterium]